MHRTIILNATDVRVKPLPKSADVINTYKMKKKSGLLPYNGLFSNAILISPYFNMFNKIQFYLFFLKMQGLSHMRPRALKKSQKNVLHRS